MPVFGFGKDNTFYDLLEAQADAAFRAASTFEAMVSNFAERASYTARIGEIEHEADDITHRLANRLDRTFITPLDKEDLSALSRDLDDVTDLIEAATGRMALYQLTVVRPDLPAMVGQLVRIAEATRAAIAALRTRSNGGREALQPLLIPIHDIEKEHDQAYRQALADLLNAPDADPLLVLKWKEVYDRVEIAVDKCEDVAKRLESVAVKYA